MSDGDRVLSHICAAASHLMAAQAASLGLSPADEFRLIAATIPEVAKLITDATRTATDDQWEYA